MGLQFLLDGPERVLARDQLGRPVRRQHQQPGRAAPSARAELVHGGVIAPVQVFEHQHERGVGGQGLDRLVPLAEHPFPAGGRLRWDRSGRCRPSVSSTRPARWGRTGRAPRTRAGPARGRVGRKRRAAERKPRLAHDARSMGRGRSTKDYSSSPEPGRRPPGPSCRSPALPSRRPPAARPVPPVAAKRPVARTRHRAPPGKPGDPTTLRASRRRWASR